MRRPEHAPEFDDFFEREARKRADCLSNKEMSAQTGLPLRYVAQRVAYMRRKMVSRETKDPRFSITDDDDSN